MHGETLKNDFWVFVENLLRKFQFHCHLKKITDTLCDCLYRFRIVKVSKGLPRQAEVAQGVPGRSRPRIFLTFRHSKGGSTSAKRTRRLYPRIKPWYSLSEAESTSGHMVLSGVPRKKSTVTPPGIDPGIVRLVAQCLNHYATPDPLDLRLVSRWILPRMRNVPPPQKKL